MQEIDSDLQCRSGVTQSLFNFGYSLKNNEEREVIVDKLRQLQIALQAYIEIDRFENLKSWFGLTDLELKIIAITFVNAIEPETVSVFLRASWYENGPTLSLERILILCQQGSENKIDQIGHIIKNSHALAWGLIQIERSHLALIQPVTIADNVFSYLLGDGSIFMKSAEYIYELEPMRGDIINQVYGKELNSPVARLNSVKGLTKNERTIFVSKLSSINSGLLYMCSTKVEDEFFPGKFLAELRNIVIWHGQKTIFIYWPDLMECCNKYSDYRFFLKLISSRNSIKLVFDDNESGVVGQAVRSSFYSILNPHIQHYQKYTLKEASNATLALAWSALSLAISKSNENTIQPLSDLAANKLALLYPILPGSIHEIFESLQSLNLNENSINLYQYCQQQCLKLNSQSLGSLAELCVPRYTLNNMVLTEKTSEKLSELINRIHYSDQLKKSLPDFMPGLKALFWGRPGTGKSMAAESIAGQLKLPLYKINLANIASKWIGETEKHLANVFDKAQKQNAVLLFDEADAVFSKRSEIESSHDKNANMGVSYLLQRMESYTGLLLLSTNFKGNLDSAFLRRFHSLVEFPMPDVNTRELLWRKAWPSSIKLDAQLEVKILAELHDFSPSQITNIAERSVLFSLMKEADVIDKLTLSKAIACELEKQDENYLASKKLNAWVVQ